MMKENINKKRAGRALPIAAAAIFATFGLGSCAALEMLDSLAAEEENAHAQSAAVEQAPAPQGSAAESAPTADSKPETAPNNTEAAPEKPVESAPPVSVAEGTVSEPESIITTAPFTDSVPEVLQPIQTNPDSSPYTDLADGGKNAGELVTPGGFSAEGGEAGNSPVQTNGSPIYSAYSDLLDKYIAHTARDPEYKPEFCHYYITDIDDNGVPELLIETGTIETDRTIYVYSYYGGDAELLGNFVAWHTKLGDGDGVIYNETSAMGSYILSTIKIQDGKLFTEREDEPFSETQIKMPLIGYSYADRSALEGLK